MTEENLCVQTSGADNGPNEKSSFGIFIAGLAIILFSLGVVTILLLWKYAQIYEKTDPEQYMSRYMSSKSDEYWKEYLFSNIKGNVSEFEQEDELFQKLYDSYLKETDLSWRYDTAESTRDSSVFVVSAGNIALCKVTMVPPEGEKLAFGRHTWVFERIIPCSFTDSLSNTTVEIIAPKEKALFVNGVRLSDKYFTGETEAPFMTELEQRIGTDVCFKCYTIENVYGALELTDEYGKSYSCQQEDGVYRYIVPSDKTYSFTVEAPESVDVYVCGAKLEDTELTGKGKNIFEGFDKYTNGEGWETSIYSATGLYTEPVITAFDPDGNELVPYTVSSGKQYFFLPGDEEESKDKINAVKSFFRNYAVYSTRAYDKEEPLAYESLLCSILTNSELFRYVANSTDAMSWASYTKVNYEEISFKDIRSLGKNAFVCTVRFSAELTSSTWKGKQQYSETTGYQILFVKSGYWVAAAMSALK